ncbi:hypothetical protein C1910_12110 [Listeria ivanovii]|uniref:hypothetical protein n=1 Tax=Listeria ivanovii TaxID=1638 RepID=UPI00065E4B42|nr:hypothetical protein [Listeria ivanovii]PZG37250.1 hypothetical protein C1910_12110 [Listeria ivanovii]
MTYDNAWVGINKNSKLDRIQLLNLNQEDRDKIIIEIENISELLVKDKLKKYSIDSLLFEDGYYINLEEIKVSHLLDNFVHRALMKNTLPVYEDIIPINDNSNCDGKLDLEKDIFKFILLESATDCLFLPIQARGIVRAKTIICMPKKLTTGKKSVLYDIGAGIAIPNTMCAQYDKNSRCLYVFNNVDFEMILGTFEQKKALAKDNLLNFKKQKFKIGAEKYSVEFNEYEKIEKAILNHKRPTIRLSKYEESSTEFTIDKIRQAVERLPIEDQVSICDEKKIIEVNECNYKTFIAIIHDAIVERLISSDVALI